MSSENIALIREDYQEKSNSDLRKMWKMNTSALGSETLTNNDITITNVPQIGMISNLAPYRVNITEIQISNIQTTIPHGTIKQTLKFSVLDKYEVHDYELIEKLKEIIQHPSDKIKLEKGILYEIEKGIYIGLDNEGRIKIYIA